MFTFSTLNFWWSLNKEIGNHFAETFRLIQQRARRRNLRIPSRQIKTNAYKTLVRPQIEYSSSVWDPYTSTNKEKIEAIQRRAARFVTNRHHNTSSPTEMIEELKWLSLERRCEIQRLTIMHKMHYNHVASNLGNYLVPSARPSRLNNSAAFALPLSHKDPHLYSFFPRAARKWNPLPEWTVNIIDPTAFKPALKIPFIMTDFILSRQCKYSSKWILPLDLRNFNYTVFPRSCRNRKPDC